jgi:hypothetical protein
MKFIRRVFAALVSIGLFAFLTYVFSVFLNPQGQSGWVTALVLVSVSAIGCIMLYAWIATPGRRIELDPGLDEDGGSIGLGLTGVGMASRRRRDEGDPDDVGGRRRRDSDDDADESDAGPADLT